MRYMIQIMLLPEPFAKLTDQAQTTLRLENGAALFRQGDIARAMFFVLSGAVQLVRHTHEGHCVVIHRATAGTLFAEASLFSDVYHCDAVASEQTVVVRLAKTNILEHLSGDPAFAGALLKRFANDVQAHRRHLEVLSIKKAEDRVFAALLSFGQNGNVMAFAAFIGLTHEATFRALASLVRRGMVVKPKRGQYEVRGTRD